MILLLVAVTLTALIGAFLLCLPHGVPVGGTPRPTPTSVLPATTAGTTTVTTVHAPSAQPTSTTKTVTEATEHATDAPASSTTTTALTVTTKATAKTTTKTTDSTKKSTTTTKPVTTVAEATTVTTPFSVREVDGGVEITGINTVSANGVYTVPSSIGGRPVVGIGDGAFYYNDSIKQIVLPDTLQYIGDQAFYHVRGLTSIVIPASVRHLGSNTFTECANLATVYIRSTELDLYQNTFSTTYQRDVSLTIYAPAGVLTKQEAQLYWDATCVEWNG